MSAVGLVTSVDALMAEQAGASYREALRVPALSLGLFAVGPGHVDTQGVHTRDEVYVVVSGRASFSLDGEVAAVGPGSVLHVPPGVPHRFSDVTGDLRVVVVFAPPEQ